MYTRRCVEIRREMFPATCSPKHDLPRTLGITNFDVINKVSGGATEDNIVRLRCISHARIIAINYVHRLRRPNICRSKIIPHVCVTLTFGFASEFALESATDRYVSVRNRIRALWHPILPSLSLSLYVRRKKKRYSEKRSYCSPERFLEFWLFCNRFTSVCEKKGVFHK